MGLAISVLRVMLRSHRARPWRGPVLTFGVQDVPASYDDVTSLFRSERCPFTAIPPLERETTTSRLLRETGGSGCIHPRLFFRLLGLDGYDDVDFTDRECPTLRHDLNEPVPESWRGRYGLVVDGGTMEHVFDVRAVLGNAITLLRVGGDVLHASPLSGWVNHGFYQLNPCLFHDFYAANGFDALESALVRLPRDPRRHAERIEPFRHTDQIVELEDDAMYRTLFVFRARKCVEMPVRVPTQGLYRRAA